MFNELGTQIHHYLSKGEDFAIAQVIDRVAPSSGKVGDKAIILESGELIGWIGGGCVRGIIIKEAIDVIRNKRYRRIKISPEGGTTETENFKEYIMSCQSEGTVEVLIEPVIPQPELIILGKSKIAQKLAIVATAADFKVSIMNPNVDAHMFPKSAHISETIDFKQFSNLSNTYVIVTTQGENDDSSVKQAIEANPRYVGFVASKKKAERIREYLAQNNIEQEKIDRLHSPVGLDINAKLASEVAISILAEIIEDFRTKGAKHKSTTSGSCCGSSSAKKETASKETTQSDNASKFEEDYYINPVCKVPVSKKNPKHIINYQGEDVYFCCDGCKVSFEKNPEQYMRKT